jgi:hypothetical protein
MIIAGGGHGQRLSANGDNQAPKGVPGRVNRNGSSGANRMEGADQLFSQEMPRSIKTWADLAKWWARAKTPSAGSSVGHHPDRTP